MDLRKAKQIAAKLDGVRSFSIADVEIREAPAGSSSPGGVRFYAALYDSRSLDLGGFTEEIRAGAFDNAVAEDDIRALVNHDANLILGRSAPAKGVATAIVTADERGLLVDIPELPDTSYARDLLVSLERGDVDQCSFGFRLAEGGDEWRKEGDTIVRTLTEVRLFDVSIVTFPAYPDTIAEARSLALALAEIREGKTLSAKNKGALESVVETLQSVLDAAAPADELTFNSIPTADVEARGLRARVGEVRDGSTIVALGWMLADAEAFLEWYADDDADKAAMTEIIARLKAMVAVEAADDADDAEELGDRSQDANDLELAAARLRALALAVPETTPTTNEEGAA
jgi:HK97 family phage prohead protease